MQKNHQVKTIVNNQKIKEDTTEKTISINNKKHHKQKKIKTLLKTNESTKISKKSIENTISSSTDSRYRFIISLVTNEKLLEKKDKNIIINGKLKNEEYESIFILEANQEVLKQNDILFKINDTYNKNIIYKEATCLDDLLEGFIYKVEIEIIDNDVNCMIYPDRKIQKNDNSINKPLKHTNQILKLKEEVKKDLNENNLEKKLEFERNIQRFLSKDNKYEEANEKP